ncbi:MAG: sel1 repeat family protein [Hamadaea sp.]|nr:sel1 repeat family protein [Hamadaea sp.]
MKRRALKSIAGIAGGLAIICGSVAVLYWTGTAGQDDAGSRDTAGTVAIYSGIAAVVAVLAQFTLALGGRLTVTARRPQAHLRSLADLCRLRRGSRLQTVGEVSDLRSLGVHAPRGVPGSRAATMPPYVARDADQTVRRVVAGSRFVLLVGQSSAGKSRTAYEAIRAAHPRLPLIVPLNTVALAEMVDRGLLPRRGILWLDNIESYLISSLTSIRLNEIFQRTGIVVVATMRDAEYIRFRSGAAEGGLNPADISDARHVLDSATNVRLERGWSAAERAAARGLAAADPRIEHAERLADTFGLAEYIAAARDLLEKWEGAWDIPGHPVGAAIVEAAVDCRRIGITEPVTVDLLRDLHAAYLERRGGRRLSPAAFDEDLTWATTPILGTVGLLIPSGDGYEAFDYLVDHTQSDERSRPVPQSTWTAVLATLPAQGFTLGANAYASGLPEVAEQCWSSAADRGDIRAMDALSVLYERTPGRAADAETWLRSAAALRHPDACFRLGARLLKAGRLDEAVEYLALASDLAHVDASFALGVVHDRLGDGDSARKRLSIAAEGGHAGAALKLGQLAQGDGRDDEALRWLSIAADAGDAEAAYRMGILRARRWQFEEARRWFEAAAHHGHVGAMYELGVLASRSASRTAEAERWLRAAVSGGHIAAVVKLVELMADTGRDEELRTVFESAFDMATPQTLFDYRQGLRESLPEMIQAIDWIMEDDPGHKFSRLLVRLALAGNQVAILLAIYHLQDPGAFTLARATLEESALNGSPHAYMVLAGLAVGREDRDECRRLLYLAGTAGSPLATACAGVYAMAEEPADGPWFRPDASRPDDPAAVVLLAAMLRQAGHTADYEQVLTRLGSVAPLGVVDAACLTAAIMIFGRPDAAESLLRHGPISDDVALLLRAFVYSSYDQIDELVALAGETLAAAAVPQYLVTLGLLLATADAAAPLLAMAGRSAMAGHPLALVTVLVAGMADQEGHGDAAEEILRASGAQGNVVGLLCLALLQRGRNRVEHLRTPLSEWTGPARPVGQLLVKVLALFEGPDTSMKDALAVRERIAEFFDNEDLLLDGLLRFLHGPDTVEVQTYTLDTLTEDDIEAMTQNAITLVATGTPDRGAASTFLTDALTSRDPFATVCAVTLLPLRQAEILATVNAAGAPQNMAALLSVLDRRDERHAAASIGHIRTFGAVLDSIERDSHFGEREWLTLLRMAGGIRNESRSASRWARLRHRTRRMYFRLVRAVMPARWRRARQQAALAEVRQLFGADGAIGAALRHPDFAEVMRSFSGSRDLAQISWTADSGDDRSDD